jgi:hypothetical protein
MVKRLKSWVQEADGRGEADWKGGGREWKLSSEEAAHEGPARSRPWPFWKASNSGSSDATLGSKERKAWELVRGEVADSRKGFKLPEKATVVRLSGPAAECGRPTSVWPGSERRSKVRRERPTCCPTRRVRRVMAGRVIPCRLRCKKRSSQVSCTHAHANHHGFGACGNFEPRCSRPR